MLLTELNVIASFLQIHPILVLLLISHFLSDFHLQTQKMADQKQLHRKVLVTHVAITCLLLIGLTVWIPVLFPLTVTIIVTHLLIDVMTIHLKKRYLTKQRMFFLLDQLLHLCVIIGGYLLWQNMVDMPQLTPSIALLLRYVLLIVLITKPTNIVFKQLFSKYQPNKQTSVPSSIAGAGALVGLLERLTIALCLAFGQFASIGLVFTAKSIARYNKISEDPLFAEYYLIGSLYSILAVLIVYGLCIG